MNKNKLINLSTSYFVQHSQALVQLGMNDPSTDTDERQRAIWDYIKEEELPIRLQTNYDFESNLGARTNNNYRFFQARANTEKQEKIDELYEIFYVFEDIMKRVIFGFEIGGELFVSVGNHRSRAHRMAQTAFSKQSCGHVIIIGDGLSDDEKRAHGLEIASRSNYETDDDIEQELEEDISHQVQCAWELHLNGKPESKNLSEKEKLQWAKSWITERKPKYKLPNRAGRLTRMANGVFATHRCQSLPFPDDLDINVEFKKHWPNSIWNPSAASSIKQQRYPCRAQFMAYELGLIWKARLIASSIRDKVWIAARAGTGLNSKITSSRSIEMSRATFLKNVVKSNKNPNHILGGYPLVERVFYVQHSHSSNFEAWEWNYQTEDFDQINPV